MHVTAAVVCAAGNFRAGEQQGTILKKLCPKETTCLQELMLDVLRPYVPEYKADVECDDGKRILYQSTVTVCRNNVHVRHVCCNVVQCTPVYMYDILLLTVTGGATRENCLTFKYTDIVLS